MKSSPGVLAGSVIALSLVMSPAGAAAADPTPSVTVLKTVTVVGQRRLPSAVIEITRPTAAHEASAAHAAFRATLPPLKSPSLGPDNAQH